MSTSAGRSIASKNVSRVHDRVLHWLLPIIVMIRDSTAD